MMDHEPDMETKKLENLMGLLSQLLAEISDLQGENKQLAAENKGLRELVELFRKGDAIV